jgi:hypothetical protein
MKEQNIETASEPSAAMQSLARHLCGGFAFVEVDGLKRRHELGDERESCWVP